MIRIGSLVFTILVLNWIPIAAAQPAGLLEQAIEESEAARPADSANADALIDEADQLVKQRKFDDAVRLYARAYRLAPGNNKNYLRLLVAKRAAGRMTAEDREALDLIREQQAGNIAQTFRTMRLDILQATQALRANDPDLARTKTDHAEALLDGLPPHVDAGVYRNQIHALSRKIKRAQDAAARDADRKPLQLSDQGEDVAEAPVFDNGEIMNVEDVLGEEQARHAYERELDAALRRNRTDWILRSNEAALAPLTDMAFPADWPALVAKRTRYRDGVIYEGQPFTGPDGQTYFTAIYDLGDLVHPVPNFYAAYPGTAREQRNQDIDRQYIRTGSRIFNGYPEELAAGLPLLHFFGGIDNNAVSTRTDPYETARIAGIIERFIGGQNGPAPAN